jgi:hypothetical protein
MSIANEEAYQRWMAEKKVVRVRAGLADQVLDQLDPSPPRLLHSRGWRWAVSVAALAVGLSRFVYLAVLARLVEF